MLTLNFALFGLYLLLNVAIGLAVARRHTATAREYFLAAEGLPWYAIGGSIIAANISTEHFIGMVGIAYAVGLVVAQWEWGNVVTFTALIWIFLPFYVRGGLYTMPEFLERRYNAHCRYFFAICCLVLWIVAQMAVVMLAGAKAMRAVCSSGGRSSRARSSRCTPTFFTSSSSARQKGSEVLSASDKSAER